ncbi:MAG: alkyl hydroperoxide reductase/Thiol specific antioxidant/Mal allergen [Crocinitomicaceae bacterium]|jgi:thiol-disulfide isomerase/thioredoxin|nr:alkyl hydroperoxide reductase/Thiol specific antioxidant/Mal allergen [Crocinitomicaceae bacterium]
MKKLIFLFGLSVALFSCGNSSTEEPIADENSEEGSEINQNLPDNFEITGQISGAVNQPLTLEAVSSKGTIQLASTTVGQDGRFVLKGNIQGMGMYQLRLGLLDTKVIPLTLSPKEKVTLNASYETYELLPVWSGTSWAGPLTEYMARFNDFAVKQVELAKSAEKLKLTQEQQIVEFLKLRKPLDDFAKATMLKDPANPANIVLTTSLTPAMGYEYWDESFLDVFKKVANAYKVKYKDSPIAESMLNQVKQMEAGLADYKLAKSGKKVAPEIALKNPEGKVIKLSSLRGKVVLVDFWASWCGPCRHENPNVVKMYNKYKDRGFTVYSVSLDKDPEAWKRAIKADGLVWPNHVSDLLEWKTPLLDVYGFNSIPYTVLVGKDGKILGTNLRGASLEQKLKEVL